MLVARLETLVGELRSAAGADFESVATELSAATATVEQLREALEHRTVLGQASGLVMCRYGLTSEAAFGVLVRLSQDTNRKVYRIACELIEAHDREAAAAEVDARPLMTAQLLQEAD